MPALDPLNRSGGMPGPAEDKSLRTEAAQRDFNDWMTPKRPTIKDEGADDGGNTTPNVAAARHDGPVVATALDGDATTDVLYGWLSRARYELSYLGRKLQATGAAGTATGNQRAQAGQGIVLGKPTASSSGVPVQHIVSAIAYGDVPVGLHPGRTVPGETAGSKDGVVTTLSLPLVWPERSLRRVVNAEGETTVWLRDYRLGAEEVASVVAEILQAQDGLPPVSRIMVNGAEAWRQGLPNNLEKS
jgi:hypothetical protein